MNTGAFMRGPRMDVSSSVTVVFAPNVSNGSGAGWRCRFAQLAPSPVLFFAEKYWNIHGNVADRHACTQRERHMSTDPVRATPPSTFYWLTPCLRWVGLVGLIDSSG